MPFTKIDNADYTNMSNTVDDYTVDSHTLDGETGVKDNEYLNTNWSQELGYYKELPEVTAVIDAKATWTVGKGYQASPATAMLLDQIKGFGKDTFNTILENMIRTYHIGGDAYAHIIKDRKTERMINIKPLPAGKMKIITDEFGIITKYQLMGVRKGKVDKEFMPEDIFHLARNRVADEIHGQSMVGVLSKIILMKNEAMADQQILMHRNIKPVRLWHVDTDETEEIATFKEMVDTATNKGENLIIPKGTVEHEMASVAPNATLNPLPWIESLDNKFYEAAGVPKVIVGGTGAITDAATKIQYLAFQQTIEEEQLFIEEQCASQLNIIIELEFPADLMNDMLSDKAKDRQTGAFQESEVAPTEEEGEMTPPQMAQPKP